MPEPLSLPDDTPEECIAIVGIGLRVPDARSAESFWQNLVRGHESLRQFSEEELTQAGVKATELGDPRYVRAGMVLDGFDEFDAEFFGLGPKDAAIMDPQHRQFLSCCWEAIEDAGHPPSRFHGEIGVFAGCGMSSYFIFNVLSHKELLNSVGLFLLRHTGNDKDFLATRASYQFDLKGPAISIQTACSTSLVAVHMGAQSLLAGECDMALAGGCTIDIPHGRGYLSKEGEILSPDGHCRAFDASSAGTVFGSGSAVVVLRRLDDAMRDGDHIYAVLHGSSVNNDGSGKVGYLAPSVDGQAAAIAEAISISGLNASQIGYVECHGTGTTIGDPIEVAALTQAFRESSKGIGNCRIGSVKTNIGHLDTAAGGVGLIKAALCLKRGAIPPSLHFERPNPKLEIESSPFVVAKELTEWPRGPEPRFAGVNSLGVGGTNAFAVLGEPPVSEAQAPASPGPHAICLSARNDAALDAACSRLASHLQAHPEQALEDIAFTLLHGRHAFDRRRSFACRDRADAIQVLETRDPIRIATRNRNSNRENPIFLLPGGGSQYPAMGRGLYDTEPIYRQHIDKGRKLLREEHGIDLDPLLFPNTDGFAKAESEFLRPSLQLPALFLAEYALAQLWGERGVQPAALLGHSMGENTAACIAGVIDFQAALGLVVLRGRLFEEIPPGGMASVSLDEPSLLKLLPDTLDLAVVNGPQNCVVSGETNALQAFISKLEGRDIEVRRIRISIAAHSRMLDPILDEFGAYLQKQELRKPTIPLLSNLTGTWLSDEEATSPDYWVHHLRETVLFGSCVTTALEGNESPLLEVGPGRSLSSLSRINPAFGGRRDAIATFRHPDEKTPDDIHFLNAFARLWANGLAVDEARLVPTENRRRVSLPTYAFQEQRYWIEALETQANREQEISIERIERIEEWPLVPKWQASSLAGSSNQNQRWLVLADKSGVGEALAHHIRQSGADLILAREGDRNTRQTDDEFLIAPEIATEGFDELFSVLANEDRLPDRIVLCWPITHSNDIRPGSSALHHHKERGFLAVLELARALASVGSDGKVHITVASNGMQSVCGEKLNSPEKALLLGACRVLPRELPNVHCSTIDVQLREKKSFLLGHVSFSHRSIQAAATAIYREACSYPEATCTVAAVRGDKRYVEALEPTKWDAFPARNQPYLRPGGLYLLTGGLGGLGLLAAEELASQEKVKLLLVSRSHLPDRSEWPGWLRQPDSADETTSIIRRILAIEESGSEVIVEQADITDVEAMRSLLHKGEKAHGPLRGILHTAGVLDEGPIPTRDAGKIDRVLAAKVSGTLVLDQFLEESPKKDDLDFFLLYSSTSARIGPPGQIDYAAANAFLDAFATSARSKYPICSVAWGIWNETGMAARSLVENKAEPSPVQAKQKAQHAPFIEYSQNANGSGFVMAELDDERDWILDEHRLRSGRSILPGSGFVDLALGAARELGHDGKVTLKDLVFLRPLFADHRPLSLRFMFTPSMSGLRLDIESKVELPDGQSGWLRHAQATLVPDSEELAPAALDISDLKHRFPDRKKSKKGEAIPVDQADRLRFGARWECLREISFTSDEALALLELSPSFTSDLELSRAHAAMLDMATGYALRLDQGFGEDGGLWVPLTYESLTLHHSLPARFRSHVRKQGQAGAENSELARFDIDLFTPDGTLLCEIRGYTMRKVVVTEFQLANTKTPSARDLRLQASGQTTKSSSPGTASKLHEHLRFGIRPEEGQRCISELIRKQLPPQVVLSSISLPSLAKQLDLTSADADNGETRFSRPVLSSDFEEPADDVERTLRDYWEELLGIEGIGVEDNFFDLGGHSLIAVRLFARIRQAFGVDFPISVLFEAPSIRSCAALLRKRATQPVNEDAQPSATQVRHVVPMSKRIQNGSRPLFLAAGMFGNILNLRHLAALLSKDRQIFGLQAQGLFGDLPPHESFEEAAREHLKEIRALQATGPYLIGGFSGGGLVAYEMAQQLLASGEELGALVMLDTPLPIRPQLCRRDKVQIHLQRLKQDKHRYFLEWLRNRTRWELAKMAKVFRSDSRSENESSYHSAAIEAAFRRCLERYEIQKIDIPIHLFRPPLDLAHPIGPNRFANAAREIVISDNGWSEYSPDVHVIEVPGDHDSMVLDPNVRVLAGHLRKLLQRADQAHYE